ncbi:hypothetical protein VNI00_009180 [Paramarasmius palmivorus]|uniref:F-box domain-containing protein n=1 Tax=Paramarasmius palmivorus TaxID=297713 RepID=A0AAW0CSA5_9AGAR
MDTKPNRSPLQIPPELIIHCLDFLDTPRHTRYAHLCSTSLVCRAWLEPSRDILFKSILVRKRTINLGHIYSKPYLAPLVRQIEIRFKNKCGPLEIPPFPNLEDVLINRDGYKNIMCNGGRLFRAVGASPQVKLESLTLKGLHVDRIQDLAAFFKGSALKHVEVLKLDETIVHDQDPDPPSDDDDEDDDEEEEEEESEEEEETSEESEEDDDGAPEQDPLAGILDVEDQRQLSEMGTINIKQLELDAIVDLLTIQLLASSPHSRLRTTSVERIRFNDFPPYVAGNVFKALNTDLFPSVSQLEFIDGEMRMYYCYVSSFLNAHEVETPSAQSIFPGIDRSTKTCPSVVAVQMPPSPSP